MKKLILIVIGAVAALFAVRKAKAAQHEQALWAEVTDSVKRG